MYSRIIISISIVFILASATLAKTFKKTSLPVFVKAKKIVYDRLKNVYEAYGNVVLKQGDKLIEAEKVIVDMNKNKAVFEGNVFFKTGKDWFKAESGTFDLNTYQGTLYQAEAFMSENHIYIRGKEIKKTGKRTYVVENAQITTCDGEKPVWCFRAKKMRVTVEGWATVSHLSFWTKGIPLAYMPYLILPAKTKRQSGFLFPYFGYSERDGFDITLPFFWDIKPNIDATFYQRYLSNRGWFQGIEFRYILNETDKGFFYFDYLHDRLFSKNRWWLRSKQDQMLPGGIYAQLDIDLVSDKDYLKEFTEGLNNYRYCDKEFFRYFHRGLSTEETALIRESNLSLTKNWGQYSIIAEAHYTQNLDKSQDEFTLQRLPQISFKRQDTKLWKTPFFLKWDTIYTHFWRQRGIKGHRIHFAPTFSLPLKTKYFEILPKLSLMRTNYFLKEEHLSRFLYETSIEVKTDLWRYYLGSFIHHLEPKIIYRFRPDVDQSDLPYFDGIDRLLKHNEVTYSLTQYLLIERKGQLQELMRLSVSQTYDFKEARRKDIPKEKRRPFKDILIELQLKPFWEIYLDTEVTISPYGKGVKETNTHFRFITKRGDFIKFNYQYRINETQDLGTEIFLQLIKNWSMHFYNSHSFYYNRDIETRFSLRYEAQCWGIEFAYSDIYNDKKFMIIFSLTGIGEIKGISFGR
ncbi:MAG: LPS assembly protein LptD [Candidatus Desulfofervidus auxilii]|nr:LPS assembly protein LptD [Candidatus Desulfofervidus auxilii]